MSGFDLFEWVKGLGQKRPPVRPYGSAGRGTGGGRGGGPVATMDDQPAPRPPKPLWRKVATAGVVVALIYGIYFWEVRRVVVPADHVLVLLKKDGSQTLPDGQIVIPRPPDANKDAAGYERWRKQYGDVNGILEQVYPEGTYFGFSPFDYDREVMPISAVNALVPNGKVGVVIKKFGRNLPHGQVLADPAKDERGPLAQLLYPGRYNEYANPHAYEIKLFDPVAIEPGQEGVVTLMAGPPPKDPNQYLVQPGEQGTQPKTEPPGWRYVNLYQSRITPIDVRSQRFAMTGAEAITFPSSDSFAIRMQGFVEWRVMPDQLPRMYVEYAEGGSLIEYLQDKVILPYARSYCRLVGSQYAARDFITGDTKLKFQQEFERLLREECRKRGIEVRQALVSDIEPPQAIKDPINDREVAKEQIKQYDQQILVAKTQAELTTQEQMADQNKAIGDANRQVVTTVKKAEQARDVAVTKANQELAVAKLRLEAAQKEADALLERGRAQAAVVLLNRVAEARPLAEQVQAFGDGTAYAQYFFYQKMAGSVKSVLANTDGPFGDLFKQFGQPAGAGKKADTKVAAEVRQ
jgi:regulator of protease activity HflC (stomatin/prohibitin superfamily)